MEFCVIICKGFRTKFTAILTSLSYRRKRYSSTKANLYVFISFIFRAKHNLVNSAFLRLSVGTEDVYKTVPMVYSSEDEAKNPKWDTKTFEL